jgi:hypothetical protein
MVIAEEEFPVGDGKVGEGKVFPVVVKGETDLATIVGESPTIFVVLAEIHIYRFPYYMQNPCQTELALRKGRGLF